MDDTFLPIIILWSLIGALVFAWMNDSTRLIDEANWIQLFFICVLTGPVTLIGFIIYFIYTMTGKMGKIFKR